MSRLEELIKKLCPNGVKYYELGQLGKFYGGLTGKSKKDFINGNAKFITYKNVYLNPELKLDVDDTVNIKENENQRTLEYGDIIFTGSSETPNECGISSVITKTIDKKLYLNSFCFIYRLNDISILSPHFAKHLFRSNKLRYQIGKTASGVTRYNVSKKLMEKVCIPIPPMEVQNKIAHILDKFAKLSEKLSEELEARKKQYEYYMNNCFKGVSSNNIKKLNDICYTIHSGKNNERNSTGAYLVYGSTGIISKTDTYCFDSEKILIARVGANAGYVHIAKGKYDVSDNTLILELKENVLLKYIYYYLKNKNLNQIARGGGQPLITSQQLKNIDVLIPDIMEQKKIVSILEKFDDLCNYSSKGIPAEIEARRKQYEYYRDKLLNF